MIPAPMAVLLWGMETLGDPCHAGIASAPAPPDPAQARLYRSIGDDERSVGHVDAAQFAYAEALRLDPGDEATRAALATVCQSANPLGATANLSDSGADSQARSGAFEQGLRLMNQGDRVSAISAFEAARATGSDSAAALLEGICAYEEGDSRRARPLFEEARGDPRLSGSALFFLGLVALDQGDEPVALTLFDDAAVRDPQIAAVASGLSRLARRQGRVVVSAMTEAGYDSNVSLAPDGTPNGAVPADGYASWAAGLLVRPGATGGPYARLAGQYRKQFQVTAYDLGDAGAALGARLGHRGGSLAAEYAYDFVSLGDAPYLSAHRLWAMARAARGAFAAEATYALRIQSFLTTATSPYTGERQDADAAVEWLPTSLAVGRLGYHFGADGTRLAELSYVEHGPAASLRLGIVHDARLIAEARLTFRSYDGLDPDLALKREDRYLDGAMAWEVDVSNHWTLLVTATGRRAVSNVAALEYTKVTAALGVLYVAGVR